MDLDTQHCDGNHCAYLLSDHSVCAARDCPLDFSSAWSLLLVFPTRSLLNLLLSHQDCRPYICPFFHPDPFLLPLFCYWTQLYSSALTPVTSCGLTQYYGFSSLFVGTRYRSLSVQTRFYICISFPTHREF